MSAVEDDINLLEVQGISFFITVTKAAQDGKLEFIKDQLGPLLNNVAKKEQLRAALIKQDFYGRNAMHYAAYKGHADVIQYFLDMKSQDIEINCEDNQGNNPLMLACVRGYNHDATELSDGTDRKQKIVQMLMDQGANIKMYARDGINNPLHWSCYFGDLMVTRLLVDKIPGLMLLRNDLGYFPMDHTLMSQKETQNPTQDKRVAMYMILKFLVFYLEQVQYQPQLDEIENNLELSRNRKQSILIQSEEFKEIELQQQDQYLLTPNGKASKNQENVQISSFSNNKVHNKHRGDKRFDLMGLRYMFWGSIMGREDILIILIQYGYSPFLLSYKGRNAVHAAAYMGHLHLIKLFFESEMTKKFVHHFGIKKTVNLMSGQKPETALHIAIQRGNQDIVLYLHQLGADTEIPNFRNLTPFQTSRDMKLKKVLQTITKQSQTKPNVVRGGYKYILIGRETTHQKDDLLYQQLVNIQEKNISKGKVKVLILKHYLNQYSPSEDGDGLESDSKNLVYYLLKLSDDIMNSIADTEKMSVYNTAEGFICRFIKAQALVYETFQHRQVQEIATMVMNDEFDLEQFETDEIIFDHFPLHDFEEVASIHEFWRQEKWMIFIDPFKAEKQTIRTLNALSNYYGPQVGFYIVFLTFFTSWLLLPAIPGILLGLYALSAENAESGAVPIYIIFLAVWATIFFEFWKRKQMETEYELDMHITKEQNKRIPQFKGQFAVEDVTHEIVIVDKRSDLWKYTKSVTPLLFLGIGLIGGQFLLFDYFFNQVENQNGTNISIISIFYGLSIVLTNEIFNFFTRLTLNFENHEYMDEKENAYIIKAFSFTFMNSYIRLFYRSIVNPNKFELEILTVSFTLSWGLLHFLRYNILPIIVYGFIGKIIFKSKFANYINDQKNIQLQDRKKIYCISHVNPSHDQNELQKTSMVEKNICFQDQIKLLEDIELTRNMLEQNSFQEHFTYLIIQFGMVAMFSSNFQLTPTLILIMSWVDIECTIYGYVKFIKRPIAAPRKGIGLWNDVLLVVGYISTVINCFTIYTNGEAQLNNLIGQLETVEETGIRNFLLLIAAEHIVLGIKFIIESVIPDVPDWVESARKRQEYLEEEWHLKIKQDKHKHGHQGHEGEHQQHK